MDRAATEAHLQAIADRWGTPVDRLPGLWVLEHARRHAGITPDALDTFLTSDDGAWLADLATDALATRAGTRPLHKVAATLARLAAGKPGKTVSLANGWLTDWPGGLASPKTTKLDLSHDPELPWDRLPAVLAGLPALQTLVLKACGLRSVPDLSTAPGLTTLVLSGNPIEAAPLELASHPGLAAVDLRGCGLPRAALHRLRDAAPHLAIRWDHKVATHGLDNARRNPRTATRLDLSTEERLFQLPADFEEFTGLEVLILDGTALRSWSRAARRIATLPRLRELSARRARMDGFPRALEGHPRLEVLRLGNNTSILDLTGGSMPHLWAGDGAAAAAALPRLEVLGLANAPSGRMTHWPTHPGIRRITLTNQYGEVFPSGIDGLPGLADLDVSGSGYRALPAAIGRCTQLRRLRLGGRHGVKQHDIVLPDALVDCGLETLEMSWYDQPALPPVVLRLATLRALILHHTQLRRLPDAIADLPELRALKLTASAMADAPPDLCPGLARCRALEHLEYTGVRQRQIQRLPDLSGTSLVSLAWYLAPPLDGLPALPATCTSIRAALRSLGAGLPPDLDHLDVEGVPVDELAAGIRSTGIRRLAVGVDNVDRLFDAIPDTVVELDLERCSPSQDALDALLDRLTGLERLVLRGRATLPPSLGRLSRLKQLTLRQGEPLETPFDPSGLVSLQEVRAFNGRLPADHRRAWRKALPLTDLRT